jgi:prepilin-type processing-associated H-X9-DG protein
MYGGFGLSYDLNHQLNVSPAYGDSAPWVLNNGLAIALSSEIVRPTKTVLFADHGDGSINGNVKLSQWVSKTDNRTPCFDDIYRWWQEAPTAVHTGGQNWSYCDGHVKWLSVKQWKQLIFYRDGKPVKSQFWTNPLAED